MAIRDYEVLVSAVMVRTGPGKNQVRRILRGGTVRGDHQNSTIRSLKAAGAIGRPGSPQNRVAQVTRAFHGFDDPVAELIGDVLPVPAPVSADPYEDMEDEDSFTHVDPKFAQATAAELAK